LKSVSVNWSAAAQQSIMTERNFCKYTYAAFPQLKKTSPINTKQSILSYLGKFGLYNNSITVGTNVGNFSVRLSP
jgi:hypothetical protein